MTKRSHFKKIIIFLFIIFLLTSCIFLLYWFFIRDNFSDDDSSSDQKKDVLLPKNNQSHINTKIITTNNQSIIENHSLTLLKYNFAKINFQGWKKTLKNNYFLPSKQLTELNNYAFKNFSFQPLLWETFIVEKIIKNFHAVNLIVIFQYDANFQSCWIKIAYQIKPKIFLEKLFTISF